MDSFQIHQWQLRETSALACLIGGPISAIRRTASWEIPAGVILAVLVMGGIADLTGPTPGWTAIHHLCSGSLLFGAFFIATDPVSSPLTAKGKFIFGAGLVFLSWCWDFSAAIPKGSCLPYS
ncbi:MAG: RnfABCDGE type electron transport complex subunit D [Desulfobacterales bacterium]